MRLKRIEIKGFKSFANETHILFDENIIGVVGPNGSGKSNIVDAIRWVLGEQSSRELRLESMGDVLFNGSKTKKPSNAATVTITFQNTKNLLPTEFNEVALTRKLFRNGDSEYRINEVKCRLKDIQNLFLDSGIGSNSYAIIALGMVDDILADKENARRHMFEQAAGISKYKSRKKETLKKLKNTEDDLERIEDLVFEIEKNLKALERQAKRTKRYYEIKEDFKQLAVDLALIRSRRIKEKLSGLESSIKKEKEAYASIDAKITQQEAQIESLKKQSLDQELALSDAQKDINKTIAKIRGKEEDIRILKQQLKFRDKEVTEASENLQSYKKQQETLVTKQHSLTQRCGDAEEVYIKYAANKSKLEEQLTTVKSQYESIKMEVDAMFIETRKLEKEVLNLERDIQVVQSKEQSYNESVARIKNQVEQRSHKLKQEQDWLLSVSSTLSDLENKIFNKEKEIEEVGQKIQDKEKDLESSKQQFHRLNRALDAKTNERKLLQEFVRNMEGFPESIKFLSKHKQWESSRILLSDILSVDPSYRGILEHFLADYLNYFVVEDFDEANVAIEVLARENKGRSGFFILNEWKTNGVQEMDSIPGCIPVLDVIKCEEKYKSLFYALFNQSYFVVDSSFSKKDLYHEGTFLFTDGSMHRSVGMMMGGSIGLFEGNKLGRKQQIEELSQSIDEIELELKSCKADQHKIIGDLNQLKSNQLKQELQKLIQEKNTLVGQKLKVETTIEMSEGEILELNKEWERLKERQQRNVKNLDDLKSNLLEKSNTLKSNQQSLGERDNDYRILSERYNEVRQQFNEANIQEIQQQNLVKQLQQEYKYSEDKIKDLTESIVLAQKKQQQGKETISELREKIVNSEDQLLKWFDERKENEKSLNDVEKVFYGFRMQVSDMESEVKKMAQNQRNVQVLINELNEKMNTEQFEYAKIIERLKIEFDITEESMPEKRYFEEFSEEEVEERVKKMRHRLANYGDINPLAVEAFEEISERHSSIISQRDDVLKARDQLVETMDEIENTATKKFQEAFDEVRLNFIKVFRRLFTEDDDCDLILLDADNPLESKIDIIAKPKGKRPKSISQLSGGEKTLTATALLFALYLLKPAPFCIFDEVDAPLDDANIYKFNKIIQEFSGDSQFIIVTHNKLTMESVDIIYGVFMENTGVSNVAAVDFRHLDKVAEFAVN
ncbi:chromosome segregation protein SMC [Membranihabitans marinus]|uniref:chromosome segregation protein SMC n=1 Tax=Membranihabitans marinus TaxID=1227546 RepID=UPI001EFFA2C6|nr:chromosome segregation protein SMC [Membranihabitans marinus]